MSAGVTAVTCEVLQAPAGQRAAEEGQDLQSQPLNPSVCCSELAAGSNTFLAVCLFPLHTGDLLSVQVKCCR